LPQAGYYNGVSQCKAFADDVDFTPENIIGGKSPFGLVGTMLLVVVRIQI
jgi:hypothetical protein